MQSLPVADAVRTYVAAHLADEHLTADAVLHALGLTACRPQVCYGLGQPLAAYIRAIRMNEACRRLRETDMAVAQIAFDLGFASHEVFTRCFCRKVGQTPSGYRRHFRKIKQNDQDEG